MATLGVRLMASFALAAIGHAAFAGPGQAMEATGSSRSSSSSSRNNAAIDAAQRALTDYLRESDRADDALLDQSAQDRLREQYEAAQRAAAEAEARQQEARQRNQLKDRYSADPALNPWGNGSSRAANRDAPRNAPADSPPASPAPQRPGAKDPGLDYAGKACEYFTRPSDESHLNYYSEGATVVYGGRVYQCRDGRWAYRYPDTVLSARDRTRLSATQQEK